jgi:lysophospholipase L1-like esterase
MGDQQGNVGIANLHTFEPMRKILVYLALVAMTLPVTFRLHAQQPAFYDEIAAFKKQDSIAPPPQGAILFVGSSSFRFWQDLAASFPHHKVINRGFGGSSLPDVIRYAGDIIFPYQPRQIVIYCGDNDLAASDTVTAKLVYDRFARLYTLIRSRMKEVDILYVSIKPSPSRERLMPKMEEANHLIADFLHGQAHAAFVDVYHLMLTPEGHPIDDLFRADKLHMTAKGYIIWQKAILPYLVNE